MDPSYADGPAHEAKEFAYVDSAWLGVSENLVERRQHDHLWRPAEKCKRIGHVRHGKRFIMFVAVGLLNTAFGSGVYAVMIYADLPIWTALLLGNLAGIVFNFFTTGRFVFFDASLLRLPRFIGVYLSCYIINYVSIRALVSLHTGVIVSQLLLAPPMAVLSFFLMSRYVFGPRASERVG